MSGTRKFTDYVVEKFADLSLILLLSAIILVPLYSRAWINYFPGGNTSGLEAECSDYGVTDHNPRNIARPSGVVKIVTIANSGLVDDECKLKDAYLDIKWDHDHSSDDFKVREDAISRPKLIVLYIHGWHHNAEMNDPDLTSFQSKIKHLKDVYPEKNIVGIYIGWNGKLISSWYYPGFWSREFVADQIGYSGTVKNIINTIGRMKSASSLGPDEFIAIGHSFGARILYLSTRGQMVADTELYRINKESGRPTMIHEPTDAVILLNPAFPAVQYAVLNRYRQYKNLFSYSQVPLMIAIASKGDWSTKYAFPFAQIVSGQRKLENLVTVGNYEKFRTHTIEKTEDETQCLNDSHLIFGDAFHAGNICLQRLHSTLDFPSHNPFIIAQAGTKLIKNHDDVWDDKLYEWISDFADELSR